MAKPTKLFMKEELLKILGMTEAGFQKLVEDIWGNFPEASQGCALRCVKYNYKSWHFEFIDTEENFGVKSTDKAERRSVTRERALAAVAAFIVMKMQGQLRGITVEDFTDASEYDATAADAIAQLAVLGEVIYG